MRYLLCGVAALALAGCEPTVPESGAGVGFGDYQTYQQQQATREAQLAGGVLPAPTAVSTETLSATGATLPSAAAPTEAERLAQETATALSSGREVVNASPSNPAPALVNAAGISNETNFDAVSSQRTIEDDKARREAFRAQYQVVEPTAVPTRQGSGGPNIVEFALSSTNSVGEPIYRRLKIAADSRSARGCAKYPSPDMAQEAFLSKGGPSKDRLGLDPDGDGFACSWDPAPFRRARGG